MMKIDISVIKEVIYGLDPSAKEDDEFVQTINILLSLMDQKQKEINKKKRVK